MRANRQFAAEILAALEVSKSFRIRTGTGRHRYIAIGFVVVKGRVFVRSWSVEPEGWYRVFRKEPRGILQVAHQKIAVRAIAIKDKTLRDGINRAYLRKYNTPGALRYAKDLASAKSGATTTEFIPILRAR